MRKVTHVVTILKLAQILRQMFRADMDMRPVNPALELRPKAFNGVRGRALKANIFVGRVIDRHMAMAARVQPHVGLQFVGVDRAAGNDIGVNDRLQGRALLVRHNRSANVPAAFGQTHHNRLGGAKTAEHCFVDLDMLAGATHRRVTVNRTHIFPDLMAHAPSRFVGHAKLAFDFLGSDTVSRSAEQEHNKEPIAQRSAGAIKRGASGRVNLMAAVFADIGAAGGNAIVMRALATARAIMAVAKAIAHDVFKAAFLGREGGLELAKGGGFRFHAHYVAQAIKCRKGIIAKIPIKALPI